MSIRSRIWEKNRLKTRTVILGTLAIFLLFAPFAMPQTQQQPATQPTPEQIQAPGPEASSQAPQAQAPQAEAQGAAPLRVLVGKSLLINTTERLKRVSVTDDSIADALVVTPTQILVHGRAGGVRMAIDQPRQHELSLQIDNFRGIAFAG